jgi:hypothetical protein
MKILAFIGLIFILYTLIKFGFLMFGWLAVFLIVCIIAYKTVF